MARPSTILDANAYRGEGAADSVAARRQRALGPAYRLFYDRPVELVRGRGTRLWDADGDEYLDAYNNVASVGHAHPRVVEAIARQAGELNTHTRYLSTGLVDYAEDLLSTFGGQLDQVMFTCTGSEANDLAVRVARHATGGTGVVVTAEAYHGNTDLISGMSPALGSGAPLGPDVWTVAAPDPLRGPAPAEAGAAFADEIQRVLAKMAEVGVRPAALLLDSSLSSDGVHSSPAGFLVAGAEAFRKAGGLVIADEVQPGFGRLGSAFWGYAHHGLTVDLATLGKPMGAGMPIAALVARSEVLQGFASATPYFNTFGGSHVPIAAAQTVLDVIREEGLQHNADTVGRLLRDHVREIAAMHPVIADVRGDGLYVGIELVDRPGSAEPGTDLASAVVNGMRSRGVLTSVCGPWASTLKVRPPLVFSADDAARFATTLERVLAELPPRAQDAIAGTPASAAASASSESGSSSRRPPR